MSSWIKDFFCEKLKIYWWMSCLLLSDVPHGLSIKKRKFWGSDFIFVSSPQAQFCYVPLYEKNCCIIPLAKFGQCDWIFWVNANFLEQLPKVTLQINQKQNWKRALICDVYVYQFVTKETNLNRVRKSICDN